MMKQRAAYRDWYRYKNSIILLLTIPLVLFATKTPFVSDMLSHAEELGLLGAFILGIFFVSTFTILPASIVLYHLALHTNPLLLALFAGLGGVVGDFFIFRYYRDRIFEEWKPLAKHLFGSSFSRMKRSPVLKWMLPVIGAVIVASPLPDEIGIGLMGLSHLRDRQFVVIVFFLDTLGAYIFALVAQSIGG